MPPCQPHQFIHPSQSMDDDLLDLFGILRISLKVLTALQILACMVHFSMLNYHSWSRRPAAGHWPGCFVQACTEITYEQAFVIINTGDR